MANVDMKQNAQKIHATMKRNGTYGKKQSRVENACFDAMCEIYGSHDVERHVELNGRDIDLFVKSSEIYVQIDGVYWHGLDRPVELIKEFRKSRDRVIYGTILRDIEMNKWAEQNRKRLVRFTDQEITEWLSEKKLVQQVTSALRLMTA